MYGKNRKKFRFLRILLLLIMIVCLIQVGQAYYLSFRHEKQQEELRNLLKQENAVQQESEEQKEEPVLLNKFESLQKKNEDLVGWLFIEGMGIDYPVMQCEDDEYYLYHNFYGEKDKYGCLYVRNIADVNTPGTNFIIYGHNMKDGSMFGKLDAYEDESFYREHALISFDTLYEERMYEILSVFPAQIQEEAEFQYYQFYQADTQEEFLDFYENIMQISLYDTGVTAEFGDTFLTLSTCSGYAEDERFVIVARRIR